MRKIPIHVSCAHEITIACQPPPPKKRLEREKENGKASLSSYAELTDSKIGTWEERKYPPLSFSAHCQCSLSLPLIPRGLRLVSNRQMAAVSGLRICRPSDLIFWRSLRWARKLRVSRQVICVSLSRWLRFQPWPGSPACDPGHQTVLFPCFGEARSRGKETKNTEQIDYAGAGMLRNFGQNDLA